MENYEEWLVKFGNRIKEERERQNLTRSALAGMVNAEQGYIVQIERGSRSPSLKTFTNLLSVLGVSSDHLIFGASEEEQSEKDSALADFSNLLRERRCRCMRMTTATCSLLLVVLPVTVP